MTVNSKPIELSLDLFQFIPIHLTADNVDNYRHSALYNDTPVLCQLDPTHLYYVQFHSTTGRVIATRSKRLKHNEIVDYVLHNLEKLNGGQITITDATDSTIQPIKPWVLNNAFIAPNHVLNSIAHHLNWIDIDMDDVNLYIQPTYINPHVSNAINAGTRFGKSGRITWEEVFDIQKRYNKFFLTKAINLYQWNLTWYQRLIGQCEQTHPNYSLLDAIEWDIRNLYDLLKARPKTLLNDRQQLLLDLGKKLIDDAYDLVHSVD